MSNDTTGVLLMAYGSPDAIEDVEAYYTHIRRGRKPTAEQLEDLKARYRAIGGSPLGEITRKVADGVEKALNESGDGRFTVYVGMKHWHPYIEDTVDRMAADGIKRAIAMALAPQYSKMSVEGYLEPARARAAEHGMELTEVKSWHDHPGFVGLLAGRVRETLERFSPDERNGLRVVFTAHSLPERILEWGDPYPEQLRETSRLVAEAAGVAEWDFAYQSASQTGTPWLGPDILDYLAGLPERGFRAVLACPVGFVADHLEILYDLDVEAAQKSDELGLHFERTRSPNADPEFVRALVDVIQRSLGS